MPGCSVTARLPGAAYREYRLDAIFLGKKWDPQVFDHNVIADRALLVANADWQELSAAAEGLYGETLRVERQLHLYARAAGAKRFLPRRAWRRLRALPVRALDDCARLMRFDFHPTDDGWMLSEVNSDVPGGLNEASSFHRFWPARGADWSAAGDPAAAYVADIVAGYGLGEGAFVGLVHATAYSDDWQQMALLQELLARAGVEAVAAAPTDVELRGERMYYRGRQLDAALRFFPGDWLLFSGAGAPWFADHPVNLSNPLGSLFSQNKFFPVACAALGLRNPLWEKYLPATQRLALSDLFGSRDLAKPSFGRVGEDVDPLDELRAGRKLTLALDLLLSTGLWIKQEQFRSKNLGSESEPIRACVGVYCANGKVIGGYGRLTSDRFVNMSAADSPVFVVN